MDKSRRAFVIGASGYVLPAVLCGYVPAPVWRRTMPMSMSETTVYDLLRAIPIFHLEEWLVDKGRYPFIASIEGLNIPIDRGDDVILIRHNDRLFEEALPRRIIRPGDAIEITITIYEAAKNPRHKETVGRRPS